MTTTFKWSALTSRGSVLTTELNSLASGAFSSAGPPLDNTTNLDRWGVLEIVLASINISAGSYLQPLMLISADGTNYEDAASSTNPGFHQARIPPVSLNASSSAKRIITPEFWLPPCKVKFVLFAQLFGTSTTFASSSNTVGLYTLDETGV